MSRGPFTQRRYDPRIDCGAGGHFWHVPIKPWERHTFCSDCGKRRGVDRKPRSPSSSIPINRGGRA